MCNFFAQPDALACGAPNDPKNPHAVFAGDRPSLSLLLDAATPFAIGQLLAAYEHRTAVQGWLWGINSFDQWGVQLGKKLATNLARSLEAARRAGPEERLKAPDLNSSTSFLLQRYLART